MLKSKIEYLGKEFSSIEGVLRAYYNNKSKNDYYATYRGKLVCLDIEDGNEDVSLFENVALQLKDIDIMYEEVQ